MICRFQNVVLLLNRIDDGKLTLLATRLAQSIVNGLGKNPFTDDELSKLELSLEMGRTDVQLVVEGLLELFFESAYDTIKPTALEERLKRTGLEHSKALALVGVWGKAMQVIVDSLRKISVLPQVSHVAYSLSVQAGSDVATPEKTVKAHLQMGLKSSAESENLDLEFTHEELYDFHSSLTRIQSQLDAIADK